MGFIILPIAAYGGFFGPGFGFLMLAFLGFTTLKDVHQMNGIKSFAGGTCAFAAAVTLSGSHLIDWRTGAVMAVGSCLGGYGGARLSQRFSSHASRIIVIVIGLMAAVYLAVRTY